MRKINQQQSLATEEMLEQYEKNKVAFVFFIS
jgi:hypothetical protein